MVPTKQADKELHPAIDSHANNSVLTVLDQQDRTVFAKRLPNDLAPIIASLTSCAGTLHGVALESTCNGY
jgi:transposase